MIRLIGYFIAFAVFVSAIVWMNNNPGYVEFDWFGYHIKSSIGLFFAAIIILIVLCIIGWRFVRGIMGAPDAFGVFFSSRRRKKGYEALSKGIIAVGSGDAKTAHKFARIAGEKLDDEPLTLLLKAQTAQLEGNKELAHKAFEKMTEQPATKMLGLRGLFVEAQRQENGADAKLIALDAVAHDSQSKWALNGLFDLQTTEGDWGGALNSLLMIGRLSGTDAVETRRKRAVLLTAEALNLQDNNAERALELSLEAKALAPELVPATILAAKLLLAKGSIRKAHKLLEKCWRLAPHPELGALFAKVKDGEKDKAWLKRVQTFAEKAGAGNAKAQAQGAIEAAVMIAKVAIEQGDWTAARKALENIVVDDPSARICTLMAKIEQGELGSKGLVAEWLARAQRAPSDSVWLADGHIAEVWAPISAVTGELDAYEWKLPDYNMAQVEADMAANILLEHHENELQAIEAQAQTIVEVKEQAKAEIAKLTDERNDDEPDDEGSSGNGDGGASQQVIVVEDKQANEEPKKIEATPESATAIVAVEKVEEVSEDIVEEKAIELQPADASPQKSGEEKSGGLFGKRRKDDGKSASPYSSKPITKDDELPRRPDDPGLPKEGAKGSGSERYYSN
ncbi:MAG: hypothetical protein OCD03_15690 [Hyphomicrobiales bacterium]